MGATGETTEATTVFLYLGPFLVMCVKPPRVSPLSFFSLGLVTDTRSTCFIRVPGTTTVRVRADTPNPPDAVTITAPAVLPIPVIPTDTIVGTRGKRVSPSPLSIFLSSKLGTTLDSFNE